MEHRVSFLHPPRDYHSLRALWTKFYGQSNPYPNLNEDSLKYLSIEQAIQDNVYFARNVKLDVDGDTSPEATPWILIGASYAGALTAFQKVA